MAIATLGTVTIAAFLTGSFPVQFDANQRADEIGDQLKRLNDRVRSPGREQERHDAKQNQPALDANVAVDIPVGDSPVLGNKSAPIDVVVFLDFETPRAARVLSWATALTQDRALRNKVRVVFKHVAAQGHYRADRAALFAFAVHDVAGDDKFFAFAQTILDKPAIVGDEVEEERQAIILGVSQAKLQKRRNTKPYELDDRLKADLRLASTLGITDTPAVFVGGYALSDVTNDGVKKLIADKNIGKAKKKLG